MKKIIVLAILSFSASTVFAANNINDISKRPYMETVEKKEVSEKVEKSERKINQQSMNFISKRPYTAPVGQ